MSIYSVLDDPTLETLNNQSGGFSDAEFDEKIRQVDLERSQQRGHGLQSDDVSLGEHKATLVAIHKCMTRDGSPGAAFELRITEGEDIGKTVILKAYTHFPAHTHLLKAIYASRIPFKSFAHFFSHLDEYKNIALKIKVELNASYVNTIILGRI